MILLKDKFLVLGDRASQKPDHPIAPAMQKRKTNLSLCVGHRLPSVGPQGGTGKAKPALSGPVTQNQVTAGSTCRNLCQDTDR